MKAGETEYTEELGNKQRYMNFLLVYGQTAALACERVSYLGRHNPVITELGWDESLSGGR